MLFSRFPLVARFCVASLDYALVVILAAVGSLWCLAVRLGFNPRPERITPDFEWWASIAIGFSLFLFWRMTRRSAWFAGRRKWRAFGATVVVILGVVGFMQVRAVTLAMDSSSSSEQAMLILQGGVFLLLLIALFMLRRMALERGWLSATSRAALTVLLAGYLVYLGWDEPVAPSVARNHAAMAGRSEDEATYRLTLRYSPAPGGGKVFTPPTRKLDFPPQGEKRTVYLRAHRAEIEANWAELAEVRAWWAEMAAQPQLGDRPGTSFEQPIIRFQPVRTYVQHALALAELKALDGDADGALAAVGDVYAVGARLEPDACTLLRGMISVVTQKQALETVEFVLDHSQVSDAARARFAALLSEKVGGGLGAKRLILTEIVNYFGTSEAMSQLKGIYSGRSNESVPMRIMNSMSGLLYFTTLNPQATANRRHVFFEKLASRSEARDLEGMKKMSDDLPVEQLGGFQVKNFSGRMLVWRSSPAFERIAQSYWETEERRASLAKRLREPSPAM